MTSKYSVKNVMKVAMEVIQSIKNIIITQIMHETKLNHLS